MTEQPNDPSRPQSGDPLGGGDPPPFTGAPETGAPPPAAPPPPPPPAAPPAAAPPPAAPPAAPGGFTQPAPATFGGGFTLAGWGSRAGALLLDGLITSIPAWIGVALIFAGSSAIGVILIILGLIAAFLYYPLTMMREGERNGQTLGKQVVNIRVVRDNGQAFDFGSALVREFVVKYLLFNFVGSFLFYIPILLDYLWPLWDDQNQALHDKLVSTHVVAA